MRIAACLIVRNEARDIAEWLGYHAAAGFDAFLVYDNASSDGTTAALEAAGMVLDVRTVHWPSRSPLAQVSAYEHAIATNKHEFDWIAFIDSDEFLVTHGLNSVRSLCAGADAAAAIGINWAMFGTSGHFGMPDGLLIEAFTHRSIDEFPANRHVKSIVRPGAVAACLNPHAFQVHGPIVSAAGDALAWQECDGEVRLGLNAAAPDFSVAQINHYFTRSHMHWARKVARGYPNPASTAKLGQFQHYDRNEVEDRSAQWNVDAVRQHRNAIIERYMATKPAQTLANFPWQRSRPAAIWARS
jgi:glycosyltransferase involved in cell wall biosynthesis